MERLSDLTKIYDLFLDRIVGNIKRGVETIKSLLTGDISLPRLFKDFVNTLEQIPENLAVCGICIVLTSILIFFKRLIRSCEVSSNRDRYYWDWVNLY